MEKRRQATQAHLAAAVRPSTDANCGDVELTRDAGCQAGGHALQHYGKAPSLLHTAHQCAICHSKGLASFGQGET